MIVIKSLELTAQENSRIFRIQIIGDARKRLIESLFTADLFKECGVQIESEPDDSKVPDLILYVGGSKLSNFEFAIPIVLGMISREELNIILRQPNPYYIVSTHCIQDTLDKKFQIPILESIHLASIFTCLFLFEHPKHPVGIVSIPTDWISKFQSLKKFRGLSYIRKNIEFFYESGEDKFETRLRMHWLQSKVKKPIYILLDRTFGIESMKDSLLPFTLLGIYQTGFLISDSIGSSNCEKMYTNIMEVWNNSHYIPKRKTLLSPVPFYKDFYETNEFDSEFERAIKRPPIFIIDSIDSILNYISSRKEEISVLFVGEFEKFEKIINELKK